MERNSANEIYEEARKVRQAIKLYGGGFMRAIGEAMDRADENNLAKIRDTWRKEWDQYIKLYEATDWESKEVL